MVKQTLALSDTPTKDNSPVTEMAYSVESAADGVFSVTAQTRYNAAGEPLSATQKQLISQLSVILASKIISTDVRGNSSVSWSEYTAAAKVTSFSNIPTSEITAEAIAIDGFTITQKDHVGIVTTANRNYTASGMILVQIDGRGNATTSAMDLAGRTISVTDAVGAITTTVYDIAHDLPSVVTDAMGNTSCYKYDLRGRKIAERGTALQPVCFGYDEADNLISLKTFRAGAEIISSDPSERMDGDETTWAFDPVTGLELSKTYADNSSVVKTYDRFNRLATETDARGDVKTHSYEIARGLLLGTTYSDGTTARQYVYNHLGQLTQVTDDAGIRSIGYNAYGEQETDTLLADEVTHLITETRDAKGRSTGFTYAKNGTVQHTVTTGYGTDGRISTAGFMHGGSEKLFSYSYLSGSNLLQTLTMPCNMTLTQSYEEKRNLLTGMAYHRGNTLVTQRTYSHDTLGLVLTRHTARNGQTVNDSFVHNSRSELSNATINGTSYGYDYDNIGNRRMAMEASTYTLYEANDLNQYTSIQKNEEPSFAPNFDFDGNQTLVKTSTDIWAVIYNAENRPIRFTSEDETTVVECSYDFMGRRTTKKVTVNGAITLHQCYIYRGYLQIACCDLTRTDHPCLWLLTWDPTQPVATRPLAIRKDGTWFAYGWDLTKNICEVFGPAGYIRTAYTYTPYGEVSATGDVEQPFQWSSEFNDTELGLVYYNYRHYNSYSGRWISRDIADSYFNLYKYPHNCLNSYDILGLANYECWQDIRNEILKDVGIAAVTRALEEFALFTGRRFATGAATSLIDGPAPFMDILVTIGVSAWTLYDLISTAYDFYQNFSAIKDTVMNFNFELDCDCMTSEQMEAYRSGITAILTAAIMGSTKPSRIKERLNEFKSRMKTMNARNKDKSLYDIKDKTKKGASRDFSATQKRKIIEENKRRNGGDIRDDRTGRKLTPAQKSQSGVTPNPYEANVDHRKPRKPADPNRPAGTNDYGNADVVSRIYNIKKSNK